MPAYKKKISSDCRPLYGAVDLGTNNCRLLIAHASGKGGISVTDSFSRITRLGEGLQASGRLSEQAMERTIRALTVCAGKLRHARVVGARHVLTAAGRCAENAEEFLEQVRLRTGLVLEIIDPREEARLALSGCMSLFEPEKEQFLVFDVGGGSSEVTLGQRSENGGVRLVDTLSLPFGVVSVAEAYPDLKPAKLFARVYEDAREQLSGFSVRHNLGDAVESGDLQMIGVSGTTTTLAAVYQELPRYDRRRVDGISLPAAALGPICEKLAAMSFAERVAHPCIRRQRADLILPGCAILQAFQALWPADFLTVADRGLREGILLDFMKRQREIA